MTNPILWWLILVQMVLGTFDILYHHEFLEHLAWRPSQRRELQLHGVRNFAYAGLFLILGCLEVHGVFAVALLLAFAAELIITLIDFVEEDRSRRLPSTERIAHTLLALNYGAILSLAVPVFLNWAGKASGWAPVWYGWWSIIMVLSAPAVSVFGLRDIYAARRFARLPKPDASALVASLSGRRRVLITGATGFIGCRLAEALAGAGHDVIALVRSRRNAVALPAPIGLITSLEQIGADETIDAVVNLAGEPIANGPWTKSKRRRILASRLRMTRDVIHLIARLERKPAVLVSGSAVGWYGVRGDVPLPETATAEDCFTHGVCARWENAANAAERYGVRVVLLRTGLVLGTEGGLLAGMLPAFEYGGGARFGSGLQWMSWIARDDLIRLIAHALVTPSLCGPLNATAPSPVRNRDFVKALGRALHRPAWFAIPALPLRLGAGALARELLLGGQRVIPEKALASGFGFRHPTLDSALAAMLGAPQRRAGRVRSQAAMPARPAASSSNWAKPATPTAPTS
jgi:uncharacterized protein (TIGR01777 family)